MNLPATGRSAPARARDRVEPVRLTLAVRAVSAVIEVERVTDAPPQTGQAPVIARTPEHDQRGAENDEPDHIV